MAKVEAPKYEEYVNEPNCTDLDHLPGDYGLPVVGDTIPFFQDPFEWAQGKYKEYGPLFKMKIVSGPAVVALGPENIQTVMLDMDKNFSSRMGFIDRLGIFFAGSLIMEDFERHKLQRRIVQNAFKNDAMKHYTEEINRIYDRSLNDLESNDSETLPFFVYIKNLLLEVAAEIFIGEKERGPHIDKMNQSFIDCVNGAMFIFPFDVPGFCYHRGLEGKRYLQKYFGDLVRDKRDGDELDILSHFCREKDEKGEYYSNEEIADQMIFLLFAAHDTTTAAITHTIYYLARNPEVKEKLYQEMLTLGKDSIDYDDLNTLPYLQNVFYETQRARTSTPIIPRRTVREVEMSGYKVPAHTMVYTIPRFEHYMEEYWTDPYTFDPDRFTPERAEHKQHPFLYHPFGGGAHKCIGMHFSQMEYKCFLYKFMLKYDFETAGKEDPKMQTLPLPKPLDDLPIKLIRRQK